MTKWCIECGHKKGTHEQTRDSDRYKHGKYYCHICATCFAGSSCHVSGVKFKDNLKNVDGELRNKETGKYVRGIGVPYD